MNEPSPIQTAFAEEKPHRYTRSEVIIGPSSRKDSVFLVESGYVKASSIGLKKQEHVLFFYGPGEVFPWRFLFEDNSDNDYYDETVYSALTDATVIPMSNDVMRQRMNNDATFTSRTSSTVASSSISTSTPANSALSTASLSWPISLAVT